MQLGTIWQSVRAKLRVIFTIWSKKSHCLYKLIRTLEIFFNQSQLFAQILKDFSDEIE